MASKKKKLSPDEEIVITIYIVDEYLESGRSLIDYIEFEDDLCDFVNQHIEDPHKRMEAFEYGYMMLLKECGLD